MDEDAKYKAAQDCILLIKEIGFDEFMQSGIDSGFIKRNEIGHTVKALLFELALTGQFDDCNYLKEEFFLYKQRTLN